ncbi:MAG TPA: hypothetical protein GX529_04190 [Firmicutes bacterium]|nr:hypothetical protein [Candidatus Fermentithermobacillaceae bacterium]
MKNTRAASSLHEISACRPGFVLSGRLGKGVVTVGIIRTSVRPVVLAGVGFMAKEGRGRETWSTHFGYSVCSRH